MKAVYKTILVFTLFFISVFYIVNIKKGKINELEQAKKEMYINIQNSHKVIDSINTERNILKDSLIQLRDFIKNNLVVIDSLKKRKNKIIKIKDEKISAIDTFSHTELFRLFSKRKISR